MTANAVSICEWIADELRDLFPKFVSQNQAKNKELTVARGFSVARYLHESAEIVELVRKEPNRARTDL